MTQQTPILYREVLMKNDEMVQLEQHPKYY
jgi:hypothetical protein